MKLCTTNELEVVPTIMINPAMGKVALLLLVCGGPPWPQAVTQSTTNDTGTARIIGGIISRQGDVPYQILLRRNGVFICGGSLVQIGQQQVIISAGHCAVPGRASEYTATAGALYRNQTSSTEQTRRVIRKIIHENYFRFEFDAPRNDIAVLLAERPFRLNNNVDTIRLPSRFQRTTGDVIASGWGNTSPESGPSDILRLVRIPVVDDETCLRIYGPSRIRPSVMCAGVREGGRGTCHGDSGGPLRAVNGGYLAGIASWVVNDSCVPPGFPVVNTEVSHYIDWLYGTVGFDDRLSGRYPVSQSQWQYPLYPWRPVFPQWHRPLPSHAVVVG